MRVCLHSTVMSQGPRQGEVGSGFSRVGEGFGGFGGFGGGFEARLVKGFFFWGGGFCQVLRRLEV